MIFAHSIFIPQILKSLFISNCKGLSAPDKNGKVSKASCVTRDESIEDGANILFKVLVSVGFISILPRLIIGTITLAKSNSQDQ